MLLSALGQAIQAALSHSWSSAQYLSLAQIYSSTSALAFSRFISDSNDKLHMRGAFFPFRPTSSAASCCRPISRIAWCCRSTFPGDLAGAVPTSLHALRAQIQEQAAIEKGAKADGNRGYGSAHRMKNRRAIIREFSEMPHEWATDDDEIGPF